MLALYSILLQRTQAKTDAQSLAGVAPTFHISLRGGSGDGSALEGLSWDPALDLGLSEGEASLTLLARSISATDRPV